MVPFSFANNIRFKSTHRHNQNVCTTLRLENGINLFAKIDASKILVKLTPLPARFSFSHEVKNRKVA